MLPATNRQIFGVWKLLGVLQYGVEVEAPGIARIATKLIAAVMADCASQEQAYDAQRHYEAAKARLEAISNAGSSPTGPTTRKLTQAEIASRPEWQAEQARIEKRWAEKTEGVVRITKCRTDAPNVPERFKMRPFEGPSLSPDVVALCFYCRGGIRKDQPIVWARLASIVARMSYRPYKPLPPSAVCHDCLPKLNAEIAKRAARAEANGQRPVNPIVYGYDAG